MCIVLIVVVLKVLIAGAIYTILALWRLYSIIRDAVFD